jgi:TPR repeat protein
VHRLVLFLVLCVFLINPLIAFASNYSDGMNAMKNGDHEEAVKLFRFAAENGDKFSQHCLGLMLYKGRGSKENYTEGFKWLNLAAKQGFSQAKLDLAIMKYHKKVTPNNYIDENN